MHYSMHKPLPLPPLSFFSYNRGQLSWYLRARGYTQSSWGCRTESR